MRYTNHSIGRFRYADHGELKYSLRSIARYAPFVRNVIIVMDGELPAWLSPSGNLRAFKTEEILPAEVPHPCFYSDVLELYLHRVPGLSEQYLYLNDDYFLAAPVEARDFFDEDGTAVVRMQPHLVPVPPGVRDDTYHHIWQNTFRSIRAHVGAYSPHYTSHYKIPLWVRRLLRHQLPWNPPHHIGQPFRLNVWQEFHRRFQREIATMQQFRFRHRTGIATNVAVHYLSRQIGLSRFLYVDDAAVVFRESPGSEVLRVKERVLNASTHGIKFFCLNDGMDIAKVDWASVVEGVGKQLFPEPSPWEV